MRCIQCIPNIYIYIKSTEHAHRAARKCVLWRLPFSRYPKVKTLFKVARHLDNSLRCLRGIQLNKALVYFVRQIASLLTTSTHSLPSEPGLLAAMFVVLLYLSALSSLRMTKESSLLQRVSSLWILLTILR